MGTITGSVQNNTPTATTQAYSPSVPLSVYRELAAELQALQAKLDTVTTQNQQLLQENQLLRREIAKAIDSVLHLQKLVDSHSKDSYHQASSSTDFRTETKAASTPSPQRSILNPVPEPVYVEEVQASYYPHNKQELYQIKSWWFTIAILLIIVMGFGAGYLIVRPLLENQSR